MVLAVAMGHAAAQTYKWKDDKGRTIYGDAPPAKGAQPVDTKPYGWESEGPRECYTILCQGQRADEARRKRDEADAAAEAQRAKAERESPPVRGMDFEVYRNLKLGMSEAELLTRAGKPDLDSLDNIQGLFVKTYNYMPTGSNPFYTIITLRGGRIVNLERTRKF
ncbi:MAG: DUF4124 domain-containing protein [Burkholderiales bacterium]